MMKTHVRVAVLWLVLCSSIMTVIACGSQNGESGQHQFTKAVVKLYTAGTSTFIGQVDAIIVLPSGVTASTVTPFAPDTASNVVVPSGQTSTSNASAFGYYYPSSGGSPATVRVVFMSTAENGFSDGEFVSVKCNINAGSHPAQSDFHLSSSPTPTVWDLNSAVISGASVTLSVSFI